jgi:hypothetical protein
MPPPFCRQPNRTTEAAKAKLHARGESVDFDDQSSEFAEDFRCGAHHSQGQSGGASS